MKTTLELHEVNKFDKVLKKFYVEHYLINVFCKNELVEQITKNTLDEAQSFIKNHKN
jgi:hypothetical protein